MVLYEVWEVLAITPSTHRIDLKRPSEDQGFEVEMCS